MMTILIVDDEERIRNIYGRTFRREGFKVLEAANATEAYEIMTSWRVDVILLDIHMAGVDGVVLYDAIRMFHRHARVIVTSVFSVESQKSLIKEATDYYDKSESIRVLVQKVRTGLRMS